VVRGIVDRDEGRGLNNSCFEGLHGLLVFLMPYERGTFASKIDEWVRDGGVTLDPDAHVARDAKKGADVGEVLAVGPVMDLGNLGIVRDVAFVVAFMSKYNNLRDSDEEFLCRDGSASAKELMEYAVDVIQMFPDKTVNLVVSRNCLIPTILGFIVHWRTLDASVIHKGVCFVRNLGLKNEDYIAVKYCTSGGPSLW
jgi:hypothetical protein